MSVSHGATLDGYGKLNPGGIEIPPAVLLRMQGYRDPSAIRADVRKIAEKAAIRAEELLAPEAYYRRVAVESCAEGALRLANGTVFHSQEFSRAMPQCREVIAFVLTLGGRLDAESISLMEDFDLAEALFIETAGWYAIEQATRRMAEHIWSTLNGEGYRLSRRLAPGYHDWPLEEQRDLFALVEDLGPPIRLLESCAMMPKMSRSGLYGLLSPV
jgi:hypothetical protein